MVVCCLSLILLLVSAATTAPVAETFSEDEDINLILVANAELEDLHPRQVIEGDIMVDSYARNITGLEEEEDSTATHLLPDEKRRKKAAMRKKGGRLWPNATVPYVFDPFLSSDAIKAVRIAMKHWMQNTCIKFVPHTYEWNYIRFVAEFGCWSWVGMTGGEQKVSTGNGTPINKYCLLKGPMVHEIGHAVGFWHEHNRPDRDEYVTIHRENIKSGREHNFHKRTYQEVDSLNVPYDYSSVMHYGKRAFSKSMELATIVPVQKGVKIGYKNRLSNLDIKQANRMYNCPEKSTSNEIIVIQSGFDINLCIGVHLINNEKPILQLLLSVCNESSLLQQWKWNEENQLYNPTTLKYIATGKERFLELKDYKSGHPLYEWLCADHFIEQPSTGKCMTVSEDSHQVIVEKCVLRNSRQLWNKYTNNLEDEMEHSLLNLMGKDSQAAEPAVESICTNSSRHTITKCYTVNSGASLGWLFCRILGYYVTGFYHKDDLTTDFQCCFTSHVFTGQLETSPTTEEEICVNTTWWYSTNEMGWFRCPAGFYFKGYLKGEQKGWHAVLEVRCCRTAQAPPDYRRCYTNSTDGSEGLHKCSHIGYRIAGLYKTDCSSMECVEKLRCCIS